MCPHFKESLTPTIDVFKSFYYSSLIVTNEKADFLTNTSNGSWIVLITLV